MIAVSVESASSSNRFNFKIIHHRIHAAVKGPAPIIQILRGEEDLFERFRVAKFPFNMII